MKISGSSSGSKLPIYDEDAQIPLVDRQNGPLFTQSQKESHKRYPWLEVQVAHSRQKLQQGYQATQFHVQRFRQQYQRVDRDLYNSMKQSSWLEPVLESLSPALPHEEPLLPGSLLVAFSTIMGSILARHRGFLFRAATPFAFGYTMFTFCYPRTYSRGFENVHRCMYNDKQPSP